MKASSIATGHWLAAAIVSLLPLASAATDAVVQIVPAITDRYILPADQPLAGATPELFDLSMARGEYESLSLVVFAAADLDEVSVTVSSVAGLDDAVLEGASVSVRAVKRWYQQNRGGYSDTSDPRLRYLTPELLLFDEQLIRAEAGENYLRQESGDYRHISKSGRRRKPSVLTLEQFPVQDAASLQPLSIAAGSNQQFWLTVYVPPSAAPGRYQATVTASVGDEVLQRLPLAIEVLPFELAESVLTYSMYYRGQLNAELPQGSVSSEVKSSPQLLADLVNMRAHGVTNPNVYQKFRTGQLGEVLELREQAGMDNKQLYYLGVTVVARDDGVVAQRLANEVDSSIEIGRQFGVEDMFFFARDEARGEELEYQFPFWEAVTNRGGKMFSAGWKTDNKRMGNFDITGGKEDLFVAHGMVDKREADRWHGKGKLIYSYQNPTGGRELPETWRRNYGLLLWQADYDGAMPYAWQHSFGNGWNDFDHVRHQDLNFTYPGNDGPIDTIQWEGFREAVDDVRYLSTLMAMAEAADGGDPQVKEIRQWIASLKSAPLHPDRLDELRGEMVARILLLQGGVADEQAPLVPASVSYDPIDSNGTTRVRWTTASRSPTRLRYDLNGRQVEADRTGLRRHHIVEIDDLQPNQRYSYEVSAGASMGEATFARGGEISTAPDLQLVVETAKDADEFAVNLDLASNYRASVAVNWNNSLLGWWRFSSRKNRAKDSAGGKLEAQLKGDAKPGDGRFGDGIELDGKGSFINIPDVEIDTNGTATVEGWFRFNSFAMDNLANMGLLSGFYQHGSNNNFYFSRTNESFEVSGALQRGVWHHIALTWDGDTASATLYLDGQPVRINIQREIEEIPAIDGLNIGRSSGYLGGLVGSATNTFDGAVDEIRVWNRVLSPAEVQATYNANKARLKFAYPLEAGRSPGLSVVGANAADSETIR